MLHRASDADDRTVVTADGTFAYTWRTRLADVIAFTCQQLNRDLTADERTVYHIAGSAPTCDK